MPEYVLILIRSLLAFVILLVLTRLMGKKQISQLTLFDYIVGITIGNIAASMAADPSVKIMNTGVALIIWGLLPIFIGIAGLKSYMFRRMVDGNPTDLIKDGQVLEKNLRKERMNTSDLMLSLRNKNTFNLDDVEFAVLETNGQLSVMKKSDVQPLTPKSFGLQVAAETDPRLVVLDGNVMEKTLTDLGYSKQWLLEQLNNQGISDVKDIFLAQIDSRGNLYTDLYKDTLEKPQLKRHLSTITASLSQAQSDLENFALQIRNPHIQQTYVQQAQQLKRSIEQLRLYMNEQGAEGPPSDLI